MNPTPRKPMRTMPVEKLNDPVLAALISATRTPALPGARCRGRAHLFDERHPDENTEVARQRQTQALGLCSRCPALDACRVWLNSLPASQQPSGVVAGLLRD
ncbi:MAG: WhiB family transcriptional regulator [Mycolicibacterium neoaurum]|uniref:hypothetical protein n=1 Tax=Mycolicibacterium neoaurum TaxID=1795 RepID=UPI002FFABA92